MSYDVMWGRSSVVTRFYGIVTGPEFAGSVERIAAHPRFDDLKFIANDFTSVLELTLDARSLDRVTASCIGSAYTNPRIRFAWVADDAGLLALTEITRSGAFVAATPTRGFRTLAEAKVWLTETYCNSE